MPRSANCAVSASATSGCSMPAALITSRASGRRVRISRQQSSTGATSFASAPKKPKLSAPRARAGNGDTATASVGGEKL